MRSDGYVALPLVSLLVNGAFTPPVGGLKLAIKVVAVAKNSPDSPTVSAPTSSSWVQVQSA